MKKYAFLLVVLGGLMTTSLSAQISVEAGYENSVMRLNDGYEVESTDPFNGFYVGAFYDIALSENGIHAFSIQPGLKYSYARFAESESMEYDDYPMGDAPMILPGMKLKIQDHYVAVPVRFQYAVAVSPDIRIKAFAVPSAVVGLASTLSFATTGMGEYDLEGSFDLFSGKGKGEFEGEDIGEGVFKRFDLSLGLGLGLELMDRFELRGGYDFGLINRYIDADDDITCKRNTFYIGLGFRF